MSEKIRLLLEKQPLPNIPFWENTHSKIFIYGTGEMAQSVYRVLIENGLVISGFLDHRILVNPFLNGLPVLNSEGASDAIVVIGIHNRDAEIPPILERLRSIGVRQIITPVELYDFFGDALGIRYWLTKRNYYFSYRALIEEVSSMWSDEASRLLYESVLEFRINGDYSLLPAPDLVHQYFPSDIPSWKTPLRFVDCGAFHGDTLLSFQQSNISFEAISAFEPDENNFRKLAQFIHANRKYFPAANLWPCGVSSSTRQLSFDKDRGEASATSLSGNSMVQCVSLDEAIPYFMPTLIKMDIEGAEYDALLGACQIINTYLPGLAVSLYHRPEHLWQLPMLVEAIAPGKYNYYMRSHAMSTFDTVLYCVPIRAEKTV